MSNVLILAEETIELLGFDLLTDDNLTFCFYPNGIVICPKKLDSKPYYYSVSVNEQKTISDMKLIKLLHERNLSNKSNYIYDKNSGNYFEQIPK